MPYLHDTYRIAETGSAYHFFPNRQAIFQAIARESNDEFREAIRACKPVPGAGWTQLLAAQVSACLDVYRRDPTYQKLLPTMSIDPESYTVEHEGNRELAVAWAEELRRHYRVPDSTPLAEKLRLMIECVDALISLALVERGAVDDDCLTECQRLATAYIGLYIPACTEPTR